jgi:ADP-ribosylglycohydrolase
MDIIRCILIGVAVGDALGFPAQFQPRSERKKRPVVDMGKYIDEYGQIRPWGEELTGLWSDDTSLTLCLTESLLGGFDLRDQAEKFVAWLMRDICLPRIMLLTWAYRLLKALPK